MPLNLNSNLLDFRRIKKPSNNIYLPAIINILFTNKAASRGEVEENITRFSPLVLLLSSSGGQQVSTAIGGLIYKLKNRTKNVND